MKPHVLVAIDALEEEHVQAIRHTLESWATCERIGQEESVAVYGEKLLAADIVLGWPEPEFLLNSRVQLLLLPSAGFEDYLQKGLERKPNFALCNARGVYSIGIAEHCIALMLAFCRRLPLHVNDMKTKTWRRESDTYGELAQSSACVVGLGDVGTAIAQRCAALGMEVVGVRKNPSETSGTMMKVYPADALREAVAEADHVISSLPGGRATFHLFNRDLFQSMKKGAFFYNFARGSVVNQDDLIEALQSRHLRGAGLDVFDEEPLPSNSALWDLDNVIVTPHVGGFAARYVDRLCDLLIKNLALYRAGQPLLNRIDLAGNS